MEHIQAAEAFLAESRRHIKALGAIIANAPDEATAFAMLEKAKIVAQTDRGEYERLCAAKPSKAEIAAKRDALYDRLTEIYALMEDQAASLQMLWIAADDHLIEEVKALIRTMEFAKKQTSIMVSALLGDIHSGMYDPKPATKERSQ